MTPAAVKAWHLGGGFVVYIPPEDLALVCCPICYAGNPEDGHLEMAHPEEEVALLRLQWEQNQPPMFLFHYLDEGGEDDES